MGDRKQIKGPARCINKSFQMWPSSLQEHWTCEEELRQSLRRPAFAEAARRSDPPCRAGCRLHGQRCEAHQDVLVEAPETLHQCHGCVGKTGPSDFPAFFFFTVNWYVSPCQPDLISEEDLYLIVKLTGCSAQQRAPSCMTTPNLGTYRTISGVCNHRWGSSKAAACPNGETTTTEEVPE